MYLYIHVSVYMLYIHVLCIPEEWLHGGPEYKVYLLLLQSHCTEKSEHSSKLDMCELRDSTEGNTRVVEKGDWDG